MKKKYNVKLSPFYDMEFIAVWEIDFGFKNFSVESIKNVEQAIIEMNTFWSDSPSNEESIDEHLEYFLTHATVKVHQIYTSTTLCKPEDLTKHLFEKEDGFLPGECGIKLIEFIDEFELTQGDLWVSEK